MFRLIRCSYVIITPHLLEVRLLTVEVKLCVLKPRCNPASWRFLLFWHRNL